MSNRNNQTTYSGSPASTTIVERRSAQRYRCCAECNVRPEPATGAGNWQGIVYNISTSGIGIALPCPVVEGTILQIEPWRWGADHVLRARVVRWVPVSFLFFHGCEFLEPLSDDLLSKLLG